MSTVTFTASTTPLTAGTPPRTIVVTSDAGPDVAVAIQGPPGPPGPAGGATLPVTAASSIGGHRVVAIVGATARYATIDEAGDALVALGVTTGAAISCDTIGVVTFGVVDEASWAWTPGAPVFLSTSGLLTQTPPAAPAFLRAVGVAVTATRIFVNPQPAIRQS